MVSLKMFVLFGIFGQVTFGIPLESPSKSLSEYFPSRIVGGVNSVHTPHMVALVVGDDFVSLICGGSIATSKYLVTAAHCVMTTWTGELIPTFHARVGSTRWSDGTVVHISNYHIHPEYNGFLAKNDIAVLEMSEGLVFGPHVGAVPMGFERVGGGEPVYATGWGTVHLWGPVPEHLQRLYMYTVDADRCAEKMKEANEYAPTVDGEVELCTLHPEGEGFGLCHGDSGSAIVSSRTGHQVGVVSWGFPCAQNAPDVNARVSAFQTFLKEHIRDL